MAPGLQEWKKNQTAFTQILLCLNNFTDFPIRFKQNLSCPGPTHPTNTPHSDSTWFTGLSHCVAFSQVRTQPHIALGGSPGGQLPALLQSQHYGHDTPSPSRSMFPNPAPPKTQAPLLSHSFTAPARFRNYVHLSANSGLLSAGSSRSLLWSRPF